MRQRRCEPPSRSWPGLSRPSTSLSRSCVQDVDARHKAGHDGGETFAIRMTKLPPSFCRCGQTINGACAGEQRLDTTGLECQNAGMKNFLLRLFTWWNSQTFGTQVWTWLYGEFVGEDEFGNRYFRTKGG